MEKKLYLLNKTNQVNLFFKKNTQFILDVYLRLFKYSKLYI
jgi:hypothetical protein